MTDLQMITTIYEAIEGKDGAEQMQALVDVVRKISGIEAKELKVERDTYKYRYHKAIKELTRVQAEKSLASIVLRG